MQQNATPLDNLLSSELLNYLPGAWGYKDTNSVFLYANDAYKKIVGLDKDADIYGLTDYDLPELTLLCVKFFREQDKHILKSGNSIKIIDIYSYDDGTWKAYFFTKIPLKNMNDEISGIIFHGQDVTDIITMELGTILANNNFADSDIYSLRVNYCNIEKNRDLPLLTYRQSEVLFYLIRGKTIKQIARALKISTRTVDDYLFQLKEKFFTRNKNDLIAKCISLGYLSIIPRNFFKTRLILEM